MPTRAMSDVLDKHEALLIQFMKGDPEAEAVLLDALHERGGRLLGDSWHQARKEHEASTWGLFWVGSAVIRQRFYKNERSVLGAVGQPTGWRQVIQVRRLRNKFLKRRSKP